MSDTLNPRAVIGGNLGTDAPDYAKLEVERLRQDYNELCAVTVPTLLEEYRAIPDELDAETKPAVVDLIKRIRDAARRILAFHEVEKQPHFRRGQGVDQFFFGLCDQLGKREKKAKDGAADVLQKRLTAYDVRVLEAENERRRLAAAEEARKAAEAREQRERAEREAAERQAEADRARNAARKAEKQDAAVAAAAEASAARVEEAVAASRAEETRIETMAKPANIMRERTASGTLATMGEEKFAEVLDRNTIDLERLRPYLPADAVATALRRYAESVGYSSDASVQIAGAKFGKRPKSLVR